MKILLLIFTEEACFDPIREIVIEYNRRIGANGDARTLVYGVSVNNEQFELRCRNDNPAPAWIKAVESLSHLSENIEKIKFVTLQVSYLIFVILST